MFIADISHDMARLHQLSCKDAGFDCEFEVRSTNRQELVDVALRHAKAAHGVDVKPEDAEGLIHAA
jgi:predicted small metal-binding protein